VGTLWWRSLLLAMGLPAGCARTWGQSAALDEAMWTYKVARGDTLIALTDELLQPGIGWRRVQRLNHVANPYRLMPGTVLRVPLAWLRTESAVAEVVFVAGAVRIERAGAPLAEPLVNGTLLRAGDSVVTGASPSALTLRLSDGTRLLVEPDSALTIAQLLLRGRSGVVVAQGPALEPEAVILDPQPGIYHLRVRTIDADGFEGPYSGAQQVEVPRRFNWWWLLLIVPLLTL